MMTRRVPRPLFSRAKAPYRRQAMSIYRIEGATGAWEVVIGIAGNTEIW